MLDLHTIFVSIDFSRASRAASSMARSLAHNSGARLHLVHAIPPVLRYMQQTLFPYAAMGEDAVSILGELRDNARAELIRYHGLEALSLEGEQPIGKAPSGAHKLEILTASTEEPVAVILRDRLSASDAQLAIVGASGESGPRPGVLGTEVEALAAVSTRPVLIVRDVPPAPITTVFAALDLSNQSQAVLQAAAEAALRLEADLKVIVAAPEPLAQDVRGIVSSMLKPDRKALRRQVSREAGKLCGRFASDLDIPFPFKERFGDFNLKPDVPIGDPVECIIARAAEVDGSLLVVGANGERRASLVRRLGRTTRALAANATCHVLVVPAVEIEE